MAYQVNNLDYGDYRYSVGDIITISGGKEYMYPDIGTNSPVSTPGISQDTRRITALWVQDATGAVVNNPIQTVYHTGPMRYGAGVLRFDQIASGGLRIKHYVSYHPNGGTGDITTQTKIYGQILILTTVTPTRTGYNFVGWNTRADRQGSPYAPGAQYGVDVDVVFYAMWDPVTYTVSYNANGGSGAPGAQTKTYGVNLTLSSATPSRTGYIFKGWATSSGGGVSYVAGGQYTTNVSVTLYAVWQAVTYTVSYNANGGSGAPGNQTKTYGVYLTLSSTRPTRTNYNFLGWGVSSGSTSVSYSPGGQYTSNASITLYAVWQLAYKSPRISNLSANRCNSAGTLTDDGTYAKISFNWATDRSISALKIEWGTSSYTSSANASGSGTSGAVNQVIGGGGLNVETGYNVRITVSDSGGSSVLTTTIPTMKLDIDVISGGGGVAIGKVAQTKNLFDVGYDAMFRKEVTIGGNIVNSSLDANAMYNTITNALIINTGGGVYQDYMWPGMIATEDVSTIINAPPGISGAFYAFRKVYSITSKILVELHEMWPQPGRIWSRVYNQHSGSWTSGWWENFRNDYDLNDNSKKGIKFDANADGTRFTFRPYLPNNVLQVTKNDSVGLVNIYSSGVISIINQIQISQSSGSWVSGRDNATIRNTRNGGGGFSVLASQKVASGSWDIGCVNEEFYLSFAKDTDYNAGTNNSALIQFTKNRDINNVRNFYGENLALIPEAFIWSGTAQNLYIRASKENTYCMKLGVTEGAWALHPTSNGYLDVGRPNFRWGTVFANQPSISTSDRNLKESITELTDKHERMFKLLKPCSFKFVNGNSGRTHVGYIAQDVEEAMTECGIPDTEFAGFCKDQKLKSEMKTRTVDVEDPETGVIIQKTEEYLDEQPIDGEYTYSLRYEEFIALNTHMIQKQQKEIDELKKQVLELKELVINLSLKKGT